MTTDVVPYVSSLFIYPVKSLDRVRVERSSVLRSGALKRDREFAIFDASGQFVNGKRNGKIYTLRSKVDLNADLITLWVQGTELFRTFHIQRERPALEDWLSEYFGFSVVIRQDLESGFPDDTLSPGPTLVAPPP